MPIYSIIRVTLLMLLIMQMNKVFSNKCVFESSVSGARSVQFSTRLLTGLILVRCKPWIRELMCFLKATNLFEIWLMHR